MPGRGGSRQLGSRQAPDTPILQLSCPSFPGVSTLLTGTHRLREPVASTKESPACTLPQGAWDGSQAQLDPLVEEGFWFPRGHTSEELGWWLCRRGFNPDAAAALPAASEALHDLSETQSLICETGPQN